MKDHASSSARVATGVGRLGVWLDPRHEDAHWARSYVHEPYARPDLDYEDYAPAYCVGYVGFAQYGGSYQDAETSLCANWARIKGGSRLALADAQCAMRAAWDRVAAAHEIAVADGAVRAGGSRARHLPPVDTHVEERLHASSILV